MTEEDWRLYNEEQSPPPSAWFAVVMILCWLVIYTVYYNV